MMESFTIKSKGPKEGDVFYDRLSRRWSVAKNVNNGNVTFVYDPILDLRIKDYILQCNMEVIMGSRKVLNETGDVFLETLKRIGQLK